MLTEQWVVRMSKESQTTPLTRKDVDACMHRLLSRQAGGGQVGRQASRQADPLDAGLPQPCPCCSTTTCDLVHSQ